MPKSDICPLSKAASMSVTTLRTAVSVEKTADKRIELKAAIQFIVIKIEEQLSMNSPLKQLRNKAKV